ncbi:MAG: hypothetical protein IKJ72_01030, partial [Mycoplasmataceae bacterium]|nr:hypothetical protein [Mycoplasmataceae bacterium]
DDKSLIEKGYIPIRPPYKNGRLQRWTWNIERAKEKIDKIIPKQNNKNNEWTLHYIDERNEKPLAHKSVLYDFPSSQGTNIMNKIGLKFDNPKNSELIKFLIDKHKDSSALILDFFAGSGTTGQAVMELNKEDGGNRKYILVQYPEKIENSSDPNLQTIFDITCERIKRSIDMYQYKESGFKTFKLVDSNFKTFDANPDDDISVLEQKMLDIENKVKEDTKVEDLIYELILKHGLLPLNEPIHSKIVEQQKIYFNESKTALFILEPINNEKYYDYDTLIKTIKDFIDQQEMINIFLRDNYFKNDEDKINFSNSIDLLKENSRKELKIEIWVI